MSWEQGGDFLLKSLREDMNLLPKNSKKVSTELGNRAI